MGSPTHSSSVPSYTLFLDLPPPPPDTLFSLWRQTLCLHHLLVKETYQHCLKPDQQAQMPLVSSCGNIGSAEPIFSQFWYQGFLTSHNTFIIQNWGYALF
ncbi:unnamed protein product [Pipistrellus nathusii]|uniref:Uncharacterized protein n=1 Tax=Pipistrellus nathusii TaxID=59473 RepID=A0ABN9ZYR5_PIPNA